jgi:D-glycero-D-manno-heptose 1,7-bisphosphate phosphatase
MGVGPVTPSAPAAVFLDRDGVLNRAIVSNGKPGAPATLREFVIVPDAPAGLEELRQRGFILIVVTNQPDVARGRQSRENVGQMHGALRRALPIDDILACFHDDSDNCACRKPRPGLLIEAQRKYGIDMSRSFLIGDRWKDIDAGNSAGCRTVLIDYGYDEPSPRTAPSARVDSLTGAVKWIREQIQMEGS